MTKKSLTKKHLGEQHRPEMVSERWPFSSPSRPCHEKMDIDRSA
jgi:hypothetical protein